MAWLFELFNSVGEGPIMIAWLQFVQPVLGIIGS
jgi:hypothetical protein